MKEIINNEKGFNVGNEEPSMERLFKNESELLLTESNQKESIACLRKLEGIKQHKEMMLKKKEAALKEIQDIKKELALLQSEFLKEEDINKSQTIVDRKKELRDRLQDLEELTHTNIGNIVDDKYLKEVEEFEKIARREYLVFKQKVQARKDYYNELAKQIEYKLIELTSVEHAHNYNRIEVVKREIKVMNISQDDGWVGKRNPGLEFSKKTIFYDGSSLSE